MAAGTWTKKKKITQKWKGELWCTISMQLQTEKLKWRFRFAGIYEWLPVNTVENRS